MSLDAQTAEGSSAPVSTLDVVGTSTAEAVRSAPRGVTLWLTGLPSSGKTTIANALATYVQTQQRGVEILDGDAVRPVLSTELGYTREDRDLNVARIGWVARRLAAHGVITIASVVSPYAQARDGVRAAHAEEGVGFLEIHVATPVAVCEVRDVKGLYGKQRDGALLGLTGVDGSYEPPLHPELRIDTSDRTVDDVVGELVALLQKENVL